MIFDNGKDKMRRATQEEIENDLAYQGKMYKRYRYKARQVVTVGVTCHIAHMIYCISGNIREVLFFANFAMRTNSQISESRENYYYNNLSSK